MDKVLLIDFENVQKIDLEYLERKDCKVCIFIGSSQNKLPFDLVYNFFTGEVKESDVAYEETC